MSNQKEENRNIIKPTEKGDPNIKIAGTVLIGEQRTPIWQLKDMKGETFYLLDPQQKDSSIFELTKKRNAIIEQRKAWNNLQPEQQIQIEQAYSPTKETPSNALPYQDYLRSKKVGEIFQQARKPK